MMREERWVCGRVQGTRVSRRKCGMPVESASDDRIIAKSLGIRRGIGQGVPLGPRRSRNRSEYSFPLFFAHKTNAFSRIGFKLSTIPCVGL